MRGAAHNSRGLLGLGTACATPQFTVPHRHRRAHPVPAPTPQQTQAAPTHHEESDHSRRVGQYQHDHIPRQLRGSEHLKGAR
eukprot:7380352-Prymnesium_polylepis.1